MEINWNSSNVSKLTWQPNDRLLLLIIFLSIIAATTTNWTIFSFVDGIYVHSYRNTLESRGVVTIVKTSRIPLHFIYNIFLSLLLSSAHLTCSYLCMFWLNGAEKKIERERIYALSWHSHELWILMILHKKKEDTK